MRLLLGAVLLFPVLAYFGTAASIVAIWERSGTFAHGYVILPISAWLIWQRRAVLRQLPVQPCWPALGALLACGFVWLLGDLGEVQIVRQYAFALMLPLTTLAVLGVPLARAMAFPLLFILFGVPFGEIFIDPLIGVTANFTVDALRATGIPVFREGNNFTIPSGSWSVVEACSGVRYLISSVTLGCLYAYLTYRSTRRRVLFVIAATIVPIIANGCRAYLIVMIGHLSGMTMAVGFDHLVYGWVFFGIVMFLLFWIGSYWRQDQQDVVADPADAGRASAPPARLVAGALAAAACVALWPVYGGAMLRHAGAQAAPQLAPLAAAGATSAPAFANWTPDFAAPSAKVEQAFTQDGKPVGLRVLYYRNPADGIKLITSTNRLVADKSGWQALPTERRAEAVGARTLAVRETTVQNGSDHLLVWAWYWIDGSATASDYAGKAMQVREKLLSGSDDGAAVMVFSPYNDRPDEARATLRAFLKNNLTPLEVMLASTKAH
jgi:exosortase A